MAVNVIYYLCRIGTIVAPNTGTVYQNNGTFGPITTNPKTFSSKDDALTILATLENGEYYFVERYFKS